MAVWLVRAGRHGEHEQKFIQESRVYVTWDGLAHNLAAMTERPELITVMQQIYTDAKMKRLYNWASQVWPFAHEMQQGDLVVLPMKAQRAVYIGEITGEYKFEPNGPDPYYHWRKVKWVGEAIPRSRFGQDLLYSLGAFMTICRIKYNDAEARIETMRKNNWKADPGVEATSAVSGIDEAGETYNLEDTARDQIAKLISAKFKGHGLARLVEAILNAQGYTTYLSPQGPDGGIDILAGTGPLGFSAPRLCVQVKSNDTPTESKAVNELRGAMQKVGASEGLFVSWSGFKQSIDREIAPMFFCVRLWTQKELLEQLFAHYDRLDEDIRAELPLKRIWTVAAQEEE